MTAGTLRQHAVAAEAIARGDLLFALYSGDPPPADDEQVWLLPGRNEPEVAANWQREGGHYAAHAPGVRCRCSVLGAYRLDARASIASPACTSGRRVISPAASSPGSICTRLIVRAWAAPESRPLAGDPAALPADEDLLPA